MNKWMKQWMNRLIIHERISKFKTWKILGDTFLKVCQTLADLSQGSVKNSFTPSSAKAKPKTYFNWFVTNFLQINEESYKY